MANDSQMDSRYRNSPRNPYIRPIAAAVAGIFVASVTWSMWPLVSVPAGHVGVVTLFGQVKETVLAPGLHTINPLAHVIEMDTRQYRYDVEGEVGTKDLQSVHGKVIVNYRVVDVHASKLYSQFGAKYWEIIIGPAGQDRMKSITPHFTAEELVTKRAEVSRQIKDAISKAVTDRSGGMLLVDDVVVANFDFTASFKKAIEEKQVAEQTALRAERDLQRIKVEADQKRASAQGEADARIMAAKAEAESFRLKSLQITENMIRMAAIEKWDGNLPQVSGGALPFVNIPYPKKGE